MKKTLYAFIFSQLVGKPDKNFMWHEHTEGYKYSTPFSEYGGTPQRWLLVFSQQAYAKEIVTYEKKMTKQQAELENKGTVKGFQVNLSFARNEEEIGRQLHTEGRFILATNDMDEGAYPNAKIISDYKDQQTLERGFRFLKDRWFMVDSIYLKSPKRIEALMMVMSLPNQLEKEVRNPTTKWIFQLMDGIGIVRMQASTPEEEPREWVTNLSIHGLPRSGEKANIQHLFIRQYQIILGPNKYSNVYVTYWENERLLEVP